MDSADPDSQPPRRSIVSVLWRIVVGASVLFTAGSAIQAGLSAILIQCWDENTDLPSPDAKHVAHRQVHICQGPTIFIEHATQAVAIAKADDPSGMARVYESNEADSKMRWADNDHLRIDIGATPIISLSLHQGAGVHVEYHVPPRFMNMLWLDERAQREDETARRLVAAGKLSESECASDKQDARLRRWRDERYIQWASENAIGDDQVK